MKASRIANVSRVALEHAAAGVTVRSMWGATLVLVFALLVAFVARSHGQCIDYDDYPQWAGAVETPTYVHEIVLAGDHAYLTGSDPPGLLVADITDAAAPEVVSFLEMENYTINGLAVYQNYVYVANGDDGLQVVDVSNPAAPAIVGNWSGSLSFVSDVIFFDPYNGDYLCVIGSGGLRVLDISVPTSPVEIGSLSMSIDFNAGGMAIAGSTLYIANGMHGFSIVSLANRSSPVLQNTVPTSGVAGDVVVYLGVAYVAVGRAGVSAVDVSYPPTAHVSWTFDTPGFAKGLVLLGSYLLVADDANGLTVIDRRIGFQPLHRTLEGPGLAHAIAVKGGHAFIATWHHGIQVADIRNYAGVGHLDTANAYSVFVRGDYAYVGDSEAGLKVVDISDPSRPATIGSVARQYYWANYVTVAGDYVYWDDSSDGMIIADIRNPSNPTIVSHLDLRPSNGPDFIAVQGDYAYVPRGTYGLQVIDISDKARPLPVRLVDTPGSAMGLVIDGDYAYLADEDGGLQIVDISNPATATIVGNLPTTLNAYEIHRNQHMIYVMEAYSFNDTRIEAFDISIPGQPTRQESISSAAPSRVIGFSGPFVCVQYENSLLDYTGLANVLMSDPVIEPDHLVPYYVSGGTIVGSLIYLASYDDGLRIFPVSCDATYASPVPDPGAPRATAGVTITSLHPNPFNPEVQVAFELPASGTAVLEVHDLQGRQVQSRPLGHLDAGRHVATWNGVDRAGRRAASGVYFVRLRSAGAVSPSRKVVMLE